MQQPRAPGKRDEDKESIGLARRSHVVSPISGIGIIFPEGAVDRAVGAALEEKAVRSRPSAKQSEHLSPFMKSMEIICTQQLSYRPV